ncbi:hypothetical protein IMG5_177910 [Ichthyophthirius multifiliis]|uniref:Uncharacterized protein n=1 Tax=Ichthyophthirius multifiliis TaxID=5932 RepID=G0R2G3_ICHMU|nr:hypothetical protein IMG5_177910 [Ichthyophthirius multifiliis]EGR28331.1 hypothetical protein IMG5_177910 [Ichthyophthirius multifiliis]|eukprot:XP_004027676.1 hypothetical protein IMG5_177910 [Ichthyophthirius multifiliis]
MDQNHNITLEECHQYLLNQLTPYQERIQNLEQNNQQKDTQIEKLQLALEKMTELVNSLKIEQTEKKNHQNNNLHTNGRPQTSIDHTKKPQIVDEHQKNVKAVNDKQGEDDKSKTKKQAQKQNNNQQIKRKFLNKIRKKDHRLQFLKPNKQNKKMELKRNKAKFYRQYRKIKLPIKFHKV